MSRARRRISRGLIALLLIVLAIGTAFFFKKTGQSRADAPEAVSAVVSAATAAGSPLAASITPAAATGSELVAIAAAPGAAPRAASPRPASVPATHPVQEPTPYIAPRAAPAPAVPVANPLEVGKARLQSQDLIGARDVVNDALRSGRLSATEASEAKSFLTDINKVIVFSARRFKDDPFQATYKVKPGDQMSRIAAAHDVTWELLCRINGMTDPRRLRADQYLKVINGPFHAVVTKGKFTVDLYLGAPGGSGSMYVGTFPVGLGTDDSTPTGIWMVEPHRKIKNPTYYSPRGEGVIGADDPKNPLGDFWIGLNGIDGEAVGKQSYGIHGTIEPASIGKQSSMGCIRMNNQDVAQVFEMLVEGKSTVRVE